MGSGNEAATLGRGATNGEVRYCHLADLRLGNLHVRFWGVKRTSLICSPKADLIRVKVDGRVSSSPHRQTLLENSREATGIEQI